MHLYPINGACHRVGADDTAFAYRHANFATVIVAAWQDPAVDQERIQWVRDYYEATAPHSEAGGYINFMADDDGPASRTTTAATTSGWPRSSAPTTRTTSST